MVIKNSVRQSEIFELLAKTRGATAEQVTKALNNEISDSKLTQTYALLNKLISKGFIESFILDEIDNQKRLYYLSKKGLNHYQASYHIPKDKRGCGLFGDYGYFTHTMYKPPTKLNKHFLMVVDAMIEIYLFKKETNLNIDFAHNLYCATKYVKPDFMFQVGLNKYFVELDRMNERGGNLNKKFENYNDYFMHTNTDQIKGIYFIIPSPENEQADGFNNKQQMRYESVVNAFLKTCDNYKEAINLIFFNENELRTLLNQKFKNHNHNHYQNQSIRKMIADLEQQEPLDLGVLGKDIYVLHQDKKVYSLNVALEFRETKIWYDLLRYQKKFGKKIKNEGILEFDDYKYTPDVNIYTSKKNLKTIIADNKYPLIISLYGQQSHKVPQIKFLE